VTVTASLDAPLIAYDAIWVCGLNSTTWPAPPRVDPFVPWYLQREAGVPAASPAGCLALARSQLDAWRVATPTLMLSFAREDDGASRSPSPLLHGWPRERVPTSGSVLARRVTAAGPALQRYRDERGRPWSAQRTVPGGARAFTLQNDCPFRAYAELQLGAVERAAAEEGVDRRQRGDLLHAALDELWGLWGGSAGLAARDAVTVAADVQGCVQRAAARRLQAGCDPVRVRAIARECDRAERLLIALASVERARPPFSISARETKRHLELGGLQFDLRIDRLDRLADGSLAIIDYKSGRTLPRDWLGDRPDIVQLLVYLTALRHGPVTDAVPVSALATLHLDESGVQFKGYVRSRELLGDLRELPEPDADWASQLQRWRSIVSTLARRFAAGEARVEPRVEACRHCALPVLCRKAQWLDADAGLAAAEEPEADA
jgi:probable DNA repair protein